MPQTHSDLQNRRTPNRVFALWAAAAAAVTVAFIVNILVGSAGSKLIVSDLGLVFSAIFAAAAAAVAGMRAKGRTKTGWFLIAASSFSWAIGGTFWSAYELVGGREVPFPSWADAGYLMTIPFAAAGLVFFPTAPQGIRARVRTLLDGLIVTASLLVISWITVVGPTYQAASESFLEKAIGLSYPLGDLALVCIVAFLAVRTRPGGRLPLALLGGGILALAVSDSGFAYLTLHELYGSGNAIDAGWLIGFLLIALAALRPATMSSKETSERRGYLGVVLPYAAVILAIIIVGVTLVTERDLETFVILSGIVIVLLVTGRQLLTLVENISLNRNLDDKVKARTAELEHALQKIAESQKLQEEFVANTSHELRTPLTVIKGNISTVRRLATGIDPLAQDLLEAAGRNTERMSHLVEDLLAATAMKKKDVVGAGSLDVVSELQDVLAEFPPKGKILEVRLPGRLVAMGDSLAFRTVMRHLLSNAEKFAPDGTTVTVEARRAGGEVHVTVTDEGPGIPEELRDQAFEQFVQVDGSTTREHGGVGLGLFIARRMAQSMGAGLVMDDSGPPGATFRLILLPERAGASAAGPFAIPA